MAGAELAAIMPPRNNVSVNRLLFMMRIVSSLVIQQRCALRSRQTRVEMVRTSQRPPTRCVTGIVAVVARLTQTKSALPEEFFIMR